MDNRTNTDFRCDKCRIATMLMASRSVDDQGREVVVEFFECLKCGRLNAVSVPAVVLEPSVPARRPPGLHINAQDSPIAIPARAGGAAP